MPAMGYPADLGADTGEGLIEELLKTAIPKIPVISFAVSLSSTVSTAGDETQVGLLSHNGMPQPWSLNHRGSLDLSFNSQVPMLQPSNPVTPIVPQGLGTPVLLLTNI